MNFLRTVWTIRAGRGLARNHHASNDWNGHHEINYTHQLVQTMWRRDLPFSLRCGLMNYFRSTYLGPDRLHRFTLGHLETASAEKVNIKPFIYRLLVHLGNRNACTTVLSIQPLPSLFNTSRNLITLNTPHYAVFHTRTPIHVHYLICYHPLHFDSRHAQQPNALREDRLISQHFYIR